MANATRATSSALRKRISRRGIFPALSHEGRYSTTELLQTEQRIIARALEGVGAGRWRVSERHLEQVLSRHPHLTWGQQEMVRRCARSGNSIEVGVGPAGSGKTTLLLAQRNETVEELYHRARELRATHRRLRGRSLWAGERQYRAGERVLCQKNRLGLGVLNGDLATVVSVDRRHKTLTLRLDRDGETRTLPSWYASDHLTYGYALTGHKAQGVMVRRAFTVAEGRTDREWGYVSMSRGQEANTLYLTRADPAGHRMHLAHQRPDATDALTRAHQRGSAQVAAVDA